MEQSPQKIAIVGAGKVGTYLAHSFKKAGLGVWQVHSRTHGPAAGLARKTGAEHIGSVSGIDQDTGLLIISVSDDQVPKIAGLLPRISGIVVHTSGTVSMDVFKGKADRYGVFYPLQTFGDEIPPEPEKIPLCIEASDRVSLVILKQTAQLLSENVYELDSRQRRTAHLAAVFACNFTNRLYSISEEILSRSGLPFDLVRPLIEETARKATISPPQEVQTGPAARGDAETMRAHLEMLRDDPGLYQLYLQISRMISKKHTGKDVEL